MASSTCAEVALDEAESTGCVPRNEEHVTERPLADAWIPDSLLERARKEFSQRYGRPVEEEEAALILGRIRAIVEIAVRNGGEEW
jgi:hypothetical protein